MNFVTEQMIFLLRICVTRKRVTCGTDWIAQQSHSCYVSGGIRIFPEAMVREKRSLPPKKCPTQTTRTTIERRGKAGTSNNSTIQNRGSNEEQWDGERILRVGDSQVKEKSLDPKKFDFGCVQVPTIVVPLFVANCEMCFGRSSLTDGL